MVAHDWNARRHRLNNGWRLQLMQLEHETANDDKAESDDDGENSDEQVVISSLILKLINLVVKVLFLIAGKT